MKPVILFALISTLSLSSAPADEVISAEDRALILDQVALCEQSCAHLDSDTARYLRFSVADVLIAVGEVERAVQIINQFDGFDRRFNLRWDARNAIYCNNDAAALRLYEELDDLTYADIVQIAYYTPPEVSLEPFERLLPEALTEEQRWLLDDARMRGLSETGGTPDEWLALYEAGLELPGEDYATKGCMNRLWCYAITFPPHAYDLPPFEDDEPSIGDMEVAGSALFAHGLHDQALQLAATLPDTNRPSWITQCVDALSFEQAAEFSAHDELSRIWADYPDDVTRFLVAVAVKNKDWPEAIAYAARCETEKLRIDLLREILSATCDAGEYVPEIREYDAELIEALDYAALRVNLLRSDGIISDRAKMQEHLNALAAEFAAPQYVTQYELVWIAPFVARAGVVAELRGAHELVHKCELALDGDPSGLRPFADVHVAEAYLILGDRESFQRMYQRRYTANPPAEDAEFNQTLYGLRNWLRAIPNLRDRIATIAELQLGAYGDQVRLWTILDWLEERGLHYSHQESGAFI